MLVHNYIWSQALAERCAGDRCRSSVPSWNQNRKDKEARSAWRSFIEASSVGRSLVPVIGSCEVESWSGFEVNESCLSRL